MRQLIVGLSVGLNKAENKAIELMIDNSVVNQKKEK